MGANYHEMNNNKKKSSSSKFCKKLFLPENLLPFSSSSTSPENNSNSTISFPDINNNNIFSKPDFMLSELEHEESNNNNTNNSNNLSDLFKPEFLKPDFNLFSTKTDEDDDQDEFDELDSHKIPRSATITCNKTNKPNDNTSDINRDNPEMSSFVQNYHNIRFSSHGHMNNISKKDIRNRAKAIKRQEENERKREEREHLNSANELSKSCIEHLLTDEI